MAKPVYSFEEMQAALHYVAKDVLGHVPSIKEYDEVRDKELQAHWDAHPEDIEPMIKGEKHFWMPTVVTVRSRYRNWGNAVSEIKKTFPNTFKNEDISYLEALIKERGCSVTEKDYEEYRKEHAGAPHAVALIKRFKNWSGALKAAGSTPTHYRYWKDEELLEMMLSLGTDIGRMPTVAEYDRAAKVRQWPVSRQFYRRFKTWDAVENMIADRLNKAVAKRGYAPNPKTLQLFVKERKAQPDFSFLRQLATELQRIPSIADYSQARENLGEESRKVPSSDDIKKRFNGSWKQALQAAGVDDTFIMKTLQSLQTASA